MSDFALGTYWRISAADWETIKDLIPSPNDFFEYEGYYYILDSDYDDEYDAVLENDLLEYVDEYLYLSSSVHFGD